MPRTTFKDKRMLWCGPPKDFFSFLSFAPLCPITKHECGPAGTKPLQVCFHLRHLVLWLIPGLHGPQAVNASAKTMASCLSRSLSLGKLSQQPPFNSWQAAQREWLKNKCFPSCSFQKNKTSHSSAVCLQLENVYPLEHSQPKTCIIPGTTKIRGGKGLMGKKIKSEFNFECALEIWQHYIRCARQSETHGRRCFLLPVEWTMISQLILHKNTKGTTAVRTSTDETWHLYFRV